MPIAFATFRARCGTTVAQCVIAQRDCFRHSRRTLLAFLLVLPAAPAFTQTTPDLGAARSFAIVSETFSNTTAGTAVDGDICFTTGPAVAPSLEGAVQTPCDAQLGTDQNSARAQLDAQSCTAIGAAVALDTVSIGGGPPGEFPPGCYSSTGAMSITTGATLALSGDGVYVFRPGAALNPAADSRVVISGGACADNVFWAPVGGTTIGANAAFVGTVFRGIAEGLSITLGNASSLQGRLLAFGSTVTTANNVISAPAACTGSGVPLTTPFNVPFLPQRWIVLIALLLMGMAALFLRKPRIPA